MRRKGTGLAIPSYLVWRFTADRIHLALYQLTVTPCGQRGGASAVQTLGRRPHLQKRAGVFLCGRMWGQDVAWVLSLSGDGGAVAVVAALELRVRAVPSVPVKGRSWYHSKLARAFAVFWLVGGMRSSSDLLLLLLLWDITADNHSAVDITWRERGLSLDSPQHDQVDTASIPALVSQVTVNTHWMDKDVSTYNFKHRSVFPHISTSMSHTKQITQDGEQSQTAGLIYTTMRGNPSVFFLKLMLFKQQTYQHIMEFNLNINNTPLQYIHFSAVMIYWLSVDWFTLWQLWCSDVDSLMFLLLTSTLGSGLNQYLV